MSIEEEAKKYLKERMVELDMCYDEYHGACVTKEAVIQLMVDFLRSRSISDEELKLCGTKILFSAEVPNSGIKSNDAYLGAKWAQSKILGDV